MNSISEIYHAFSIPFVAHFGLVQSQIHPAYQMSWIRRVLFVRRLWKNTRRLQTGTSYKAHIAIAAKLMQIPPETPGVVVECGAWLGGSTTNLSLICDVVGRDLIVYDSFEGLPPPTRGDKYATEQATGHFMGSLETVRGNVEKYGSRKRCEYRKGWFSDSLPSHQEPIALMFLDVDWQSSLHDCIVNLWPHLIDEGYVFIDEYMYLDYCALFWSESFWEKHFDQPPPGLMGSGAGVGVGQYYLGPFDWSIDPTSVAYTRKNFSGHWNYQREN